MPPKPTPKSITNLSQIDISKMDIKDLQNIDYQKLLKNVRQKPDIALSIVLPLVALFVCFNIFTKSQTERKTFAAKNYEMQEKLKILKAYTLAQTELQNFIKSLPPKITENEFINKITDAAAKSNVQIDSFSPAQNKSDPLYDLTMINLAASAENFSNVGLFINDIENSGASIRLDSWNGSMETQQGNTRRTHPSSNADNQWTNFRIDIVLVTFKE